MTAGRKILLTPGLVSPNHESFGEWAYTLLSSLEGVPEGSHGYVIQSHGQKGKRGGGKKEGIGGKDIALVLVYYIFPVMMICWC